MLLAVACAVVLGGSADSARTQGGAGWSLKPVADGQKWLRVEVSGDTLYGFRLRGTDFTVTGIKSVRASGGPTPQCSISGSPATLACDGELPGGISVFVQLTTSGAGGAYEFAPVFQPGDTDLFQIPSNQQAPPAPLGGSLGRTGNGAGRVTISNPGRASFQQFEVAPIGFRVSGVATTDCGVTEGGGIACQRPLGPGKTAVVRFSGAVEDSSSAYLLATSASETGLAYVPYGEACPDSVAASIRVRSEASVVRAHLAVLLHTRAAKRFLAPLRRKLAALEKQITATQHGLLRCEQTGRKVAAASACDAKILAVGHASGREAGLRDALPTERRVAGKVKALRSLPASTQKKLAAAKAKLKRVTEALLACDASLAQG
jgi:hypothetical protein